MKTISKKLIGFIAAAAMTVSLLPVNIAFAEGEYESWTKAAEAAQQSTDYTIENGTYIVKTAKGLAFVAKEVNRGDTDINITLAADIDLSTAGVSEYGENTVTAANSWIPIGNSSYKYVGTFDGAEHSISNLYIYSSDLSYSGLFGYIGENGTVKDTTISNGKVVNSKAVSYAAAFAGNNGGRIEKCINYCNVVNDGEPPNNTRGYAAGLQVITTEL